MADVKPVRSLSKDRWSALSAWFKALELRDEGFEPVEIEVLSPVETRGFVFLRGVYRAA